MQILITKEDLPIIREALASDSFNGLVLRDVIKTPPTKESMYINIEYADATDVYLIAQWVQLEKTKSLLNQ